MRKPSCYVNLVGVCDAIDNIVIVIEINNGKRDVSIQPMMDI